MPISIRGCPAEVHQALKQKARANHRSLNAEVLALLETETEKPLTGLELAQRLRKARKLMTEREHRAFGEDLERGMELMRRERLY